jgi:VWFA-related protein
LIRIRTLTALIALLFVALISGQLVVAQPPASTPPSVGQAPSPGQVSPSPPTAPANQRSTTQQRTAEQQSTPTFRSDTSEVLVPALVTDQQGNVIYGLTAKDFVVRDNGVEQTVRVDESFSSKPVSMVVAVQTGGRASEVIGSGCALQRNANEYTRQPGPCKSTLHGIALMLETFLNAPGSQMALVSFDSAVKLRRDFSSNITDVTKALDTLPGGDTDSAVLDALQFSLNMLKKRPADHRKVLVVISEQKDHGSKTVRLDEAARQIIASDIEVYMVAYPPDFRSAVESVAKLFGPARSAPPTNVGPGGLGPGGASSAGASLDLLGLMSLMRSSASGMESNVPQAISNLTGGEYVLFHNEKGLDEALGRLANHAHNRYELSFRVKNPAPGPHRLEVFLREGGGAQIWARAGYWPTTTPTSNSAQSPAKD